MLFQQSFQKESTTVFGFLRPHLYRYCSITFWNWGNWVMLACLRTRYSAWWNAICSDFLPANIHTKHTLRKTECPKLGKTCSHTCSVFCGIGVSRGKGSVSVQRVAFYWWGALGAPTCEESSQPCVKVCLFLFSWWVLVPVRIIIFACAVTNPN